MQGNQLAELHQAVLAARIGYAHRSPILFQGTVGDNCLMSLGRPQDRAVDSEMTARGR